MKTYICTYLCSSCKHFQASPPNDTSSAACPRRQHRKSCRRRTWQEWQALVCRGSCMVTSLDALDNTELSPNARVVSRRAARRGMGLIFNSNLASSKIEIERGGGRACDWIIATATWLILNSTQHFNLNSFTAHVRDSVVKLRMINVCLTRREMFECVIFVTIWRISWSITSIDWLIQYIYEYHDEFVEFMHSVHKLNVIILHKLR